MAMTVKIGPNRGIGVQILPSAGVAQDSAPATHDDNRLALAPLAHLREGMPDKLPI
jgi:hypothetical protein